LKSIDLLLLEETDEGTTCVTLSKEGEGEEEEETGELRTEACGDRGRTVVGVRCGRDREECTMRLKGVSWRRQRRRKRCPGWT
jgi:hypothetical protein